MSSDNKKGETSSPSRSVAENLKKAEGPPGGLGLAPDPPNTPNDDIAPVTALAQDHQASSNSSSLLSAQGMFKPQHSFESTVADRADRKASESKTNSKEEQVARIVKIFNLLFYGKTTFKIEEGTTPLTLISERTVIWVKSERDKHCPRGRGKSCHKEVEFLQEAGFIEKDRNPNLNEPVPTPRPKSYTQHGVLRYKILDLDGALRYLREVLTSGRLGEMPLLGSVNLKVQAEKIAAVLGVEVFRKPAPTPVPLPPPQPAQKPQSQPENNDNDSDCTIS